MLQSSRWSNLLRWTRIRLGRTISPIALTTDELLLKLHPFEQFLLTLLIEDESDARTHGLQIAAAPVAPNHQTDDTAASMSDFTLSDKWFGMPGVTALTDISATVRRLDPHGSPNSTVLEWLSQDLQSMHEGIPPMHHLDEYLLALKLLGNDPDGTTLMSRVLNSGNVFGQIRQMSEILRMSDWLINSATRRTLNQHERQIAQILISIVDRQIVREGGICPLAMEFAARAIHVLPEMWSDQASAIILNS